jgi:hypothetical protein
MKVQRLPRWLNKLVGLVLAPLVISDRVVVSINSALLRLYLRSTGFAKNNSLEVRPSSIALKDQTKVVNTLVQ